MSATQPKADELRWVVCPVCRQALQREGVTVRCVGCARRYPIIDGIPVLIADRTI